MRWAIAWLREIGTSAALIASLAFQVQFPNYQNWYYGFVKWVADGCEGSDLRTCQKAKLAGMLLAVENNDMGFGMRQFEEDGAAALTSIGPSTLQAHVVRVHAVDSVPKYKAREATHL